MSLLDQTIYPTPVQGLRVVYGQAGDGRVQYECYQAIKALMDTGLGMWASTRQAADMYGMCAATARAIYYRERKKEKA